MALTWAPKDPDEVLDYALDWSGLLGTDTIATSTWTVPSGIDKDSDSKTNTTTTIWLSGGTAGVTYVLTNTVVTNGGRTLEDSVSIPVTSISQNLVALERVKQGLKIESPDWDDLLADVYIPAASRAVINYLKSSADVLLDLDSGGNMPLGFVVPQEIQMATIVLIGYWFRAPDSDPDKEFEQGFLPRPVTALLYPLRDPALA